MTILVQYSCSMNWVWSVVWACSVVALYPVFTVRGGAWRGKLSRSSRGPSDCVTLDNWKTTPLIYLITSGCGLLECPLSSNKYRSLEVERVYLSLSLSLSLSFPLSLHTYTAHTFLSKMETFVKVDLHKLRSHYLHILRQTNQIIQHMSVRIDHVHMHVP